MSAIDPAVTSHPWYCGLCRRTRPAGDVRWPITIGTTETGGCTDCAMGRDELTAPRGDDT